MNFNGRGPDIIVHADKPSVIPGDRKGFERILAERMLDDIVGLNSTPNIDGLNPSPKYDSKPAEKPDLVYDWGYCYY